MNQNATDILFEQALQAQKAGEYQQAIELYKILLQKDAANTDVLNLLGLSYHKIGNYKLALTHAREAVKLCGDFPDYRLNYGTALRAAGDNTEAAKQFRKVLKMQPQSWQARINLARILAAEGKDEQAEKLYREALELNPQSVAAEKGIADMVFNQKKFNEARKLYEAYRAKHADDYETLLALGSIYFSLYRHVEAEALLRAAISYPNPTVEGFFFHGQALRQMERHDDAKGAYLMALSKNNDHFETRTQLYDLLSFLGQTTDADRQIEYIKNKKEWLEEKTLAAIICAKHFINTCDHKALAEVGNPLERDDIVEPEFIEHMSLSGLVQSCDAKTSRTFAEMHKVWGDGIMKFVPKDRKPAKPNNTGKIRVGFLSSDLRRHSVGKFAFPLLTQYDRNRFEFFCYTSAKDDGDLVQEELRKHVDGFTFLGHKNYEEIADLIAGDHIDILVEMNGFTLGSRLAALAYRPAPVQVEWLGYPFTTGLSACDYFLVDQYLKPEGENIMAETPLVLENGCFVCFGEFEPVPAAAQLPVEKNGYITFGSLNNVYKLTPQTVALWADVMKRVPDSRLMIVRREFQWEKVKENLLQDFAAYGITADRIELTPNKYPSFLTHYNDMDISLDTLPLTGGTTTADALWMGVPVVSLAGDQVHERISHSILCYTGVPELSFRNKKDYIEKAVQLSGDIPQLKKYRAELRGMMQNSSLCRTNVFVDNFQNMLQQLVQKHGLRA